MSQWNNEYSSNKNQSDMMSDVKAMLKKYKFLLFGVVVIFLTMLLWNQVFDSVESGTYHVTQAAIVGTMDVQSVEGMYIKMFADERVYRQYGNVALSNDPLDDDSDTSNDPIRVVFPDGWADTDVVFQYDTPTDDQMRVELRKRYPTDELLRKAIKQQVIEACKNTGTLMSSGQAYADRKSEFVELSYNQALHGLYAAEMTVDTVQNADNGDWSVVKRYNVKYDDVGIPIIKKESMLGKYGITLSQYNVKDMEFDPETTNLINARKLAQKAREDAIREEAEGQTRIAKALADEEVIKIKAVTTARKEKEVAELKADQERNVAELNKLRDQAVADAKYYTEKKNADANALLVKAGLTPLEQANIEKETRIGIADALSGTQWPIFMVIGNSGGSGGSGDYIDPIKAMGMEAMFDLTKKLSNERKNSK